MMKYAIFVAILVFYAFDIAVCQVPGNCLRCICQVEGCNAMIGRCVMDSGSLSCGPYQIKEAYWIDCGRPGSGWRQCTMTMACSETCVHDYMRRYASRCTGGRAPTCQDYAKIHNGGPNGCRSASNVYWNRVRNCLN